MLPNSVSQYKTKCYQCQKVIQRVRDLLDNIDIIRKNEVLAICDHCKRSNLKFKCRRCEYMLERFISCRVHQTESLRDEYAAWRQTVKNTLMTIIDVQNTCPHRVCFVRNSDTELKKLINLLKVPSPRIQPRVDTFPSRKIALPLPVDDETKNVLLEMINEISLDKVSNKESASFLSTCMCRYFNERKNERMHTKVSLELPVIKDGRELPVIKDGREGNEKENSQMNDLFMLGASGMLDGDVDKNNLINQNALKGFKKVSGRGNNGRSFEKSDGKKKQDGELTDEDKANTGKSPGKTKERKYKLDPEYELMLQLIKIHKEEAKLKAGKTKSTLRILKNMPKIDPLPELPVCLPKPRRSDAHLLTAGSTLVCTPRDSLPRVMIRGTRMVSRDQQMKTKTPTTLEPILFKNQIQCVTPVEPSSKTSTMSSSSKSIMEEMPKSCFVGKGITKYALSKKEFIDKGWTMLPTTKTMRRMNIYKMEPTNPHFDWFKTHAHKRALFYDTTEILAEINENGCGGKWFYKNGSVALHFCHGRHDKYRYIIYDLNEDEYADIKNIRRPVTILACFDYLGNGVVYDQSGKARIKYNQSEGIVIDSKIGAPSKWKWHSLNDPPVLQNVYMDNKIADDTLLQNLIIPDDIKVFNIDNYSKEIDEDMLAIEFENFVKGKAKKIMQKMTSYKIRMKAVKINEFFSLRIMDQENIYILFRNGHICLKLNIGMHLKSNEIIDTITIDVAEVLTPYDDVPDTKSLSDIHDVLRCMQNFSKSRH
ncbi:uncharacterized protein LOC111000497 [Pieris rapae]|uniref:uncharacterized protein LOC111000497 n=1 Tax=Pieris rapae TaxID=64459 RepID=UPI001E27D846|nr:uncharacterized protein LOC111000497 [Pieris rapae]